MSDDYIYCQKCYKHLSEYCIDMDGEYHTSMIESEFITDDGYILCSKCICYCSSCNTCSFNSICLKCLVKSLFDDNNIPIELRSQILSYV